MQYHLSNAYIVVSTICGAVGLLHLAIFLRRRKEKVHCIFAVMALSASVATLLDLRLMSARDMGSFVYFLKATNTFQVLLWISFAWFIQAYSRSDLRRPVYLVTGLYLLSGILNLVFRYGILFLRVDGLDYFTLPWGERMAFGIGPANPWRLLPDISWFVVLSVALLATVRIWKGERDAAHGFSVSACLPAWAWVIFTAP